MERRGRIAMAFAVMAFAVIVLTGCTTEKNVVADKLQQQTEYDAEKDVSDGDGTPNQETEQSPKEKELQAAVEEENRKAAEDAKILDSSQETVNLTDGSNTESGQKETYQVLMEAVRMAIEADDAGTLHELQESEEAKSLAASVRDGEHYIYFPDGGDSGKGIGYYTFSECSCKQWYYGDYKDGQREGKGIWYYVSNNTEDGSLYKEVYDGDWKRDAPNGKGRQVIALGDKVDTNKKFKVKNGLFYGTYHIKDKLEDGTVVRGKYKLKKGKYVTISDEELEANNFAVPEEPHLAIAFLYNKEGAVKSCSMVYAQDVTKGVKHFYPSE